MQIVRTDSFVKDFEKLSTQLQKQVVKQLGLLVSNPKHPSLNIKKIRGTKNIFKGRITKSYRFTFHLETSALVLRRIGQHDRTIKNP